MKRITVLLLAVLVGLSVTGCASSGVQTELSETVVEACDFYQKARPHVVAYRAWAVEHWDDQVEIAHGVAVPVIPAEQKELLRELDSYLPRLEKVGETVCAVAAGVRSTATRQVDWDRALAVTLKVATTALELKASGAF